MNRRFGRVVGVYLQQNYHQHKSNNANSAHFHFGPGLDNTNNKNNKQKLRFVSYLNFFLCRKTEQKIIVMIIRCAHAHAHTRTGTHARTEKTFFPKRNIFFAIFILERCSAVASNTWLKFMNKFRKKLFVGQRGFSSSVHNTHTPLIVLYFFFCLIILLIHSSVPTLMWACVRSSFDTGIARAQDWKWRLWPYTGERRYRTEAIRM